MRRSSSPSIQFLAAAAASTESATMSSRPPYRGGRNQWRRGYSDRPSGGGRGGGGRFVVTGDSHFQSVSDANRGFRPVDRENFANQIAYQSQPRPQPHFNPNPHFNAPPPFNPPQYFNPPPRFNPPPPFYNPPPPPFNQNQRFRPPQQFRPRHSKPLDYRNWESAKLGPPSHCERFTVLSYNILADYLAINHRSKLYFHIPRQMLDWEWRKRNIIFELGLWSADVLCFQEVDKFRDLEEELKLRGYSGIWKMRTGDPVDGCAIFWRVSRFKLLHEECIEFNKLGLRDNVAQICVLESLNQNDNKDMPALPLSLTGSNKVVICNIHVLYNPRRGEIKLGQIRVLLDRARAVSKLWDDAPVVLCGDFNCTPKSPLYDYISEQKLNFSDLPRDMLSGQASAEIRPPRQFSPNFRSQPADSRGGAAAVVDHGELRQSGSPLDVQEQNSPELFINRLSQHRCVNTGLNVDDSNSISGKCGNENSTSSCEMTKETHQEVDGCKDETRSTVYVPDGGLDESPSSPQDEVGFLAEQMKDGQESTTVDFHHGHVYSNLIETGLANETLQDAVDGCKDDFYSAVSDTGLKESASIPQNQGEVSGAQNKCGHEFTPADSRHEDIYSDLMETEHGKNLYSTIDPQRDSSSEQSQPNLQTKNESMNCDKRKFSLDSNDSTDAIIDRTASGAFESGISSSELSHETSSQSTLIVSTAESSENLSSLSIADEKMETVSLQELAETNEEDESFSEDSSKFLSELHDGNGSFSSDFSHSVRSKFGQSDKSFAESGTVPHNQQLHPPRDEFRDDDPVEALKFAYDPSAWTPMEIETATGNADCTLVEHPLKLRSTYAEVEDCSGTRDSNGEPLVTSYNRGFLGTVDYIWRSEGLQTVRVLAPMPKQAMQWTPGFPTKKWGSDHIALVSELAFVKDGNIQDTSAP